MATARRKDATDELVAVEEEGAARLLLKPSPAARRLIVFLLALFFGVFGAVFLGWFGLLTAAGGALLGLRATARPVWVLDRAGDVLRDHTGTAVGTVGSITEIKVKGEPRIKEGNRIVHYVALVGPALPGGQVKVGRWTPRRIGPVVSALAGFLNVLVVEKGEPMPGAAAPAPARR